MNEFYAMGNGATMFPDFIEGWGGEVRGYGEGAERET